MNPNLYAFIVSSPSGVSRDAIARWAQQHGRNPRSVLQDCARAARRGILSQRHGHGFAHVAVSVVYYVPQTWHGERRA